MGIMSIILTVVGIVLMLVHYALSAMPAVIVTGILTTVAFIAAYVLDMRHQSAKGGIRTDMFNPALLGHGMSGTLLVVGAIMCVIANVM